MGKNRRDFLKFAGLTGATIAGGGITKTVASEIAMSDSRSATHSINEDFDEQNLSIIGLYGQWANSLTEKKLPSLSYRRKEFTNLDLWRKTREVAYSNAWECPILAAFQK
jgi:hypothetical protein